MTINNASNKNTLITTVAKNRVNQQTETNFAKEIKLAQTYGANATIMPMGGSTSIFPVPKADILNPNSGTQKPYNPYETRSSPYVPENIQRNDQLMYNMMSRYPNPTKAPKDFILYLSKWLIPEAETRAPAVYALATDYMDQYVLMTESGKLKKGLSKGEKASHNRDGSERPDNGKPPKKPEPKEPYITISDNLTKVNDALKNGTITEWRLLSRIEANAQSPIKKPDTPQKSPQQRAEDFRNQKRAELRPARQKTMQENAKKSLEERYGPKGDLTAKLPKQYITAIREFLAKNNLSLDRMELRYPKTKCNSFNPTDATKMSPQQIQNAKDGFIRRPDGTLGFKIDDEIIPANEVDFTNLQ
jgi:hypothetical protein